MQCLKETYFLKHNPDTLEVVRKEFDLHQPGRMGQSIDRLNEWVKSQPHFNKKDFSRDYLEGFIINSQGSVEKAKGFLEKLCAYKTFTPQYFSYDKKPIKLSGLENIKVFCMPKLTKNHHRIIIVKNTVQKDYTAEVIVNFLIKAHFMLEYAVEHNYALGNRVILDYRKTELTYLISALKYTEARNGFIPMFKGYATRVKSIHIITTSRIIDILVTSISQIISPKMLGRIYVHTTLEDLYEHFDKDLLPSDYGGKEKSSKELNDDLNKELSTDEYMAHIKDMFQATINPTLKPMGKFDDLFTELQGTFRTLSID